MHYQNCCINFNLRCEFTFKREERPVSDVDIIISRLLITAIERKQKSMKKFKIFDPLAEAAIAADPIQSKEDNNDGDPHLVHANADDTDNVDALVPCEYCGRTFSASRIKRHAEERTESTLYLQCSLPDFSWDHP